MRTFCPLFSLPVLYPWFPLPYARLRYLKVFARFYYEVAAVFIILCVLCLPNRPGLCSAFLEVHLVCTLCYIQRCSLYACFASQHRFCAMLFSRFPSTLHDCSWFVMFSNVLIYPCFSSQTSGLCSAISSPPFCTCILCFVYIQYFFCYAKHRVCQCSVLLSASFG